MLPVTCDLRCAASAFSFSHVTRASAARAWCSLRAQWAVSLCGSRMTLLHKMECGDVIPVAILKGVMIYIDGAHTQFCA